MNKLLIEIISIFLIPLCNPTQKKKNKMEKKKEPFMSLLNSNKNSLCYTSIAMTKLQNGWWTLPMSFWSLSPTQHKNKKQKEKKNPLWFFRTAAARPLSVAFPLLWKNCEWLMDSNCVFLIHLPNPTQKKEKQTRNTKKDLERTLYDEAYLLLLCYSATSLGFTIFCVIFA